MSKTVYDIIKKQNGESFARAIRNYDSGIFEIPNIVHIVKHAGRDAEPLLKWLESLKHIKIKPKPVHADPIELLSRAGYDAYVADTSEKQNAIAKYFAPGEKLCTFADKNRYENYYIINAVRRGADKIPRSANPQREDEYGTSVISIQVYKQGGFISIKNRYNHTVDCPDNTFNSNPDNIIDGLSDAIKNYFGTDFSAQRAFVPNNFIVVGNQICKYNIENHGIYYGPDFYIKGQVYELKKNIEWMVHPGLIFNVSTKKADYKDKDLRWVQEFIEQKVSGKPIQITRNVYGGYDIVANRNPIISFQNGKITWINSPIRSRFESDVGLSDVNFVRDTLDFSGISALYLLNVDVSRVNRVMFCNNAYRLYIDNIIGLKGDCDFSNTRDLTIMASDLSNVNLKLNQRAKSIDLSYCSGLAGNYDLSGVLFFDCTGADCSRVSFKLNPRGVVRGLGVSHPSWTEFVAARDALRTQNTAIVAR